MGVLEVGGLRSWLSGWLLAYSEWENLPLWISDQLLVVTGILLFLSI